MDIREVARKAKVSTATVSRVLNGSPLVRETTAVYVRKVIAALNYVPNRSAHNLRVGRTRLFGLIISDINNPFFPELIDAFEAMATKEDIEVIFMHTNYDLDRLYACVRRMIDRNVDGIAVMTSEVSEAALQQALLVRIPLVVLNQQSLETKYCNVPVEYSVGFQEALEHLRSLGHRKIGFISGPSNLSSAQRREKAFLSALDNCGLKVRSEWIASGNLRVDGGRLAMKQLLSLARRPTAIVASNDLMAVGALLAAQQSGIRVPEELSIIGFDDLPIAGLVHPPLSTLHLPRAQIAANAFTSLLESTRTGSAVRCPVVYPRLVIRQSTTHAPKRTKTR